MPWNQTCPMDERTRFIETYLTRKYNMSELCARFNISRKTGYKWLDRFREGGRSALADLSRAPRSCPHRTPAEIEELIVKTRKDHPKWGAPMIIDYLTPKHPDLSLPAYSTAHDILRRNKLIAGKARRRRSTQAKKIPLVTSAPNQIWGLDYKGQFRLGNAQYCYPLTLSDQYSRYVLTVRSHKSISGTATMRDLEAVFHEYGLPDAIRTDNGVPFATHGMLGLSKLGVWFIKLSIAHQRIQPGKPWQNGRHERMHKTLKAHTTRPPEFDHVAQQHRFDDFVEEFNHVRPHQAIGRVPPDAVHHPSRRPMPARLSQPEYPGHFEVRRISSSGDFKFKSRKLNLSLALAHEYIGLEEIDDSVWSIFYYETLLARLDERTHTITP